VLVAACVLFAASALVAVLAPRRKEVTRTDAVEVVEPAGRETQPWLAGK
jgi:hypothetical protein